MRLDKFCSSSAAQHSRFMKQQVGNDRCTRCDLIAHPKTNLCTHYLNAFLSRSRILCSGYRRSRKSLSQRTSLIWVKLSSDWDSLGDMLCRVGSCKYILCCVVCYVCKIGGVGGARRSCIQLHTQLINRNLNNIHRWCCFQSRGRSGLTVHGVYKLCKLLFL